MHSPVTPRLTSERWYWRSLMVYAGAHWGRHPKREAVGELVVSMRSLFKRADVQGEVRPPPTERDRKRRKGRAHGQNRCGAGKCTDKDREREREREYISRAA